MSIQRRRRPRRRQGYQQQAKAQLDKINAQIDELKAKAKNAKANTTIEYQRQLDKLYIQRDAANAKLKNLEIQVGKLGMNYKRDLVMPGRN